MKSQIDNTFFSILSNCRTLFHEFSYFNVKAMIKQYFVIASLLLIFSSAFAKEDEKKVKSEIKEVTVFLSGAQVTNTATVSLNTGTTNVVFEELSQYVWDNNIQARGDGDRDRKSTRLNPVTQ